MIDLWQAHYLIFLITLQKEFVKANVKADCFLEYKSLINYVYLLIKITQKRLLMKIKTGNSRIHLIFLKKFKKAFNFCNNDINKFILLLKKSVYPYEYRDDWKNFD